MIKFFYIDVQFSKSHMVTRGYYIKCSNIYGMHKGSYIPLDHDDIARGDSESNIFSEFSDIYSVILNDIAVAGNITRSRYSYEGKIMVDFDIDSYTYWFSVLDDNITLSIAGDTRQIAVASITINIINYNGLNSIIQELRGRYDEVKEKL